MLGLVQIIRPPFSFKECVDENSVLMYKSRMASPKSKIISYVFFIKQRKFLNQKNANECIYIFQIYY